MKHLILLLLTLLLGCSSYDCLNADKEAMRTFISKCEENSDRAGKRYSCNTFAELGFCEHNPDNSY